MDDQNNPGGSAPTNDQSGQTPPADQPVETPVSTPGDVGSAAPQEQKCVTCGNSASGGTCMACGQGEVTCSCTPASSGGGMGSPVPGGEGAPAV